MFQWVHINTSFYGWELNLTPLANKQTRKHPNELFWVKMPHLHRISKSQLRNEIIAAYKTSGSAGVEKRLKNYLVV
jgi:hypothetical protein